MLLTVFFLILLSQTPAPYTLPSVSSSSMVRNLTTREMTVRRLLRSGDPDDIITGLKMARTVRWRVVREDLIRLLSMNIRSVSTPASSSSDTQSVLIRQHRMVMLHALFLLVSRQPRLVLPVIRKYFSWIARSRDSIFMELMLRYGSREDHRRITALILKAKPKEKVVYLSMLPLWYLSRSEWISLFRALMASKEAKVRVKAASLAVTLGADSHLALGMLLDRNQKVRIQGLRYLLVHPDPHAMTALVGVVASPASSDEERALAVRILRKNGVKRKTALKLLRQGITDAFILLPDGVQLSEIKELFSINIPEDPKWQHDVTWRALIMDRVMALDIAPKDVLMAETLESSSSGFWKLVARLVMLRHVPVHLYPEIRRWFLTRRLKPQFLVILAQNPETEPLALDIFSSLRAEDRDILLSGATMYPSPAYLPFFRYSDQVPPSMVLEYADRVPSSLLEPAVRRIFLSPASSSDSRIRAGRWLLTHSGGRTHLGSFVKLYTRLSTWSGLMMWANALAPFASSSEVHSFLDSALNKLPSDSQKKAALLFLAALASRSGYKAKVSRRMLSSAGYMGAWLLSDRQMISEISAGTFGQNGSLSQVLSLVAPVPHRDLATMSVHGFVKARFLPPDRALELVFSDEQTDRCTAINASVAAAPKYAGLHARTVAQDPLVQANLTHPYSPSAEKHMLLVRVVSSDSTDSISDCVIVTVGYRSVALPYPADGLLFVRHLPAGDAQLTVVKR